MISFSINKNFKERYLSLYYNPFVIIYNLFLVGLNVCFLYNYLSDYDSNRLVDIIILTIPLATLVRLYLNHKFITKYSEYWITTINKTDGNNIALQVYKKDELIISDEFNSTDISFILSSNSSFDVFDRHAVLRIKNHKDIIQYPILEWEKKLNDLEYVIRNKVL